MFQSHRYFSFFLSLSLLLMNYFAFYIIVSNRSFSSNFKFQRFSFFFLFHCFVTILGWKLRFERRQRDNVPFIPDEDYLFEEREKERERKDGDKRAMVQMTRDIRSLYNWSVFRRSIALYFLHPIGPIKYAKRVTSEAWCMEILTSLRDASLLSDLTLSSFPSRYYSLYDANLYRCSR